MDNEEQEFNPELIQSHNDFALAIRYSQAWIWWMLHGFRYRKQTEIDYIHENKCKPCVYYDAWNNDEGECGICGCPLNKKRAIDNKIAYISTYCPLPKNQRRW